MENPVDALNAAFKISLLLGDRRRKEEVSNGVAACRTTFCWKSMLEERARRRLGIRERDQTVAKITDWGDAELFAKDSRRASIIREGDDCGEQNALTLKATERCGHPCPAAEHHHTSAIAMCASRPQRVPEPRSKPHGLAPRDVAMLNHNRGGANDRRKTTRKRLNEGNGSMPTTSTADRDTQTATTVR
jgi:hypothetical protein